MGCNKDKISIVMKVAVAVTILSLAVITPLSIAAEDNITVTFDPEGGITLDVSPETANFTAVTAGSTDNGPTEGAGDTDYTVYNNGSVDAEVYIYSNATTDSAEMSLDNAGSPEGDEFSMDITGTTGPQQITSVNSSWISPLSAGGSETFGIDLDIGATLSSDFGYQQTTIYVTATVAT